MKFEVVNMYGKTVMHTSQEKCIPDKNERNLLYAAGYRFKLNGKTITKKKLEEELKE